MGREETDAGTDTEWSSRLDIAEGMKRKGREK